MAGISDKELVEGFLDGQRHVMDALVEENYARVLSLACKVLKNEDEARDIAQDTFVRIFDKIGQFRFKSSLRTWILSIAYNLCLNRVGSVRTSTLLAEEHEQYSADAGESEYERFLSEQRLEVVEKAVASLPDGDRLIIELFYLDDCSIREIALILQRSETAAKTALFRAREKLKSIVLSHVNYEFN